MSKGETVFLVYQKDFSENGKDRYFIYKNGAFSEVDSFFVVALECFVVTHDFWLIATSLYKKHQRLPRKVIDVVLLAKIVAGVKSIEGDVQPWDITKTISPLFNDKSDFDRYLDVYYRRSALNIGVLMLFSHKMSGYFDNLSDLATSIGEIERFYNLEVPVFNILTEAACKGFKVSNDIIRKHKDDIELSFYRELKSFAEKHGVMYELPNEGMIREKLLELGYNVGDYSLEFLIDFLPSKNGYSDDLRSLQKTNKSYRVFNSISRCSNRLYPIVESHWTSTSRIYYKSPSLQNISKKYRDIFVPDLGKSLCYIDYDQFEVGVMADLSGDPKMKSIYQDSDAYKDLAELVFGDEGMRKKAKIIFLSYTYGMSMENILSSVKEVGGSQKNAAQYFSEFNVFENWKSKIHREFFDKNRVGTIEGNYLNRTLSGELTEKEKRSSVNHVVQGTATFIFKNALLELSNEIGVEILIPMHDAVLFQHTSQFKPNRAKQIFESVMTKLLSNVSGKASIEKFFIKC
ncbi:DNA polymerase [Pseudomonadota bacterium 24LQ007]